MKAEKSVLQRRRERERERETERDVGIVLRCSWIYFNIKPYMTQERKSICSFRNSRLAARPGTGSRIDEFLVPRGMYYRGLIYCRQEFH